jgi:hypothetical protein
MKKLFMFTTACMIIGILFSSCKSGMSITKRHYNKGYYIARSSGMQADVASRQNKMRPSVFSMPKPEEGNKIFSNKQNEMEARGIISPSDRKTLFQKDIVQAKKHPTYTSLFAGEKKPSKVNSTFSDVQKIMVASSGEGLSLLWIIIVVILVLWAVGYLAGGFGLGGFINLLLLVALILLILWLLRIL